MLTINKVLIVTLFGCLAIGCAGSFKTSQISESEAGVGNYRALGIFYCEKGRWPKNEVELRNLIAERSIPNFISDWKDLEFKITREVELEISYVLASDSSRPRRSVSYIAPRCMSKTSEIILGAGALRFVMPKEFRSLNSSEIEARYGQGPYPDFVYLNEPSAAMISVRFTNDRITEKDLENYRKQLVTLYEKSPGYKLRASSIVQVYGRNAAQLSFNSDSALGELRNDYLFVPVRGQILTIYLITPVKSEKQIEPLFRKFQSSLALSDARVQAIFPSADANNSSLEDKGKITVITATFSFNPELWKSERSKLEGGAETIDLLSDKFGEKLRIAIQENPTRIEAGEFLSKVSASLISKKNGFRAGTRTGKIIKGLKLVCQAHEANLEGAGYRITPCVASSPTGTLMVMTGGVTNIIDENAKQVEDVLETLRWK